MGRIIVRRPISLHVLIAILICPTLLELVSCKNSGDTVSPDSSSISLIGKVIFQGSSGPSGGVSRIDFGAQPLQPLVIVPDGMEPRSSSSGQSLVYWKSSGPLFVSNIDGSNATPIVSLANGYFNWPDWSPDGQLIVFQYELRGQPRDELVIVDRTGSGYRELVDTLTVSRATMPRWSPDGSLVAFLGQDSLLGPYWLTTIALDGSAYTRRSLANAWWVPEWSPDSRKIAFAGPPSQADQVFHSFVLDLASGRVSEIGAGTQPIRQARWLPDGRLLSWDESSVYVAGKEAPYTCQLLMGGFSAPPIAVGSPDSTQVGIFGHRSGGSLDFYVLPSHGGLLQRITIISSSADAAIPESVAPQWVR